MGDHLVGADLAVAAGVDLGETRGGGGVEVLLGDAAVASVSSSAKVGPRGVVGRDASA
ncbi:hypothetical protein [Roseitranquillus sediminis]|uniref:hypothetical protein n=1 Tax=Roseitranquillus sediminis TaxID=2809051 RepID=UPI001D0C59A8|nr:hypothetical protein [Roseitranquillus sediminis]